MAVSFHKMHGLGNDFVVLDLRHQNYPIDAVNAALLADRHTGIGCDQVLVLRPAHNPGHLASFEVWNADGSSAEQCGNGVRCLGLYLERRGETPAGTFGLEGPAGGVEIQCLGDDMVQANMGKPLFAAADIPLRLPSSGGWYTLEIDHRQYQLGAANLGNPHALLVVDDIETAEVARLGAAISRHPAFPEGCNAGFVEITDDANIRLRVFERGAAETRACGSGACAAVSILQQAGQVGETVNVTQAGGNLIITRTGGNPIMMTGPATYVFEGNLI